jgi:mRNA interferase MazF
MRPTNVPTSRSKAFAPFDVVVVPFPYSDRLAEKRRPAVVISSAALAKYDLVWLTMVTSASNRRWNCDVAISDLGITGLPAPSLVRPAKIATVDADRILRRIGKLTDIDARAVAARLKDFLG